MKAEEHFNPETVALIHTIEKGDKEQAQTMLDFNEILKNDFIKYEGDISIEDTERARIYIMRL